MAAPVDRTCHDDPDPRPPRRPALSVKLLLRVAGWTIVLALPRFAHQHPDSPYYLSLAGYLGGDVAFQDLENPFTYRLLVPFLVSLMPEDMRIFGFAVVGILCLIAGYFVCALLYREIFETENDVRLAIFLLVFSFPSINYSSGLTTDAAGFLFFSLMIYFMYMERWILFILSATIGVLARDPTLSMVAPAALVIFSRHYKDSIIKYMPLILVVVLFPVLVHLAVREYFSDLGNYYWYFSLPEFLGNITRPTSLITTGATVLPLAALLVLGLRRNGLKALAAVPGEQRLLFVTVIGLQGLIAIATVFSVYMSGRYFWPLYVLAVPLVVLAIRGTKVDAWLRKLSDAWLGAGNAPA